MGSTRRMCRVESSQVEFELNHAKYSMLIFSIKTQYARNKKGV